MTDVELVERAADAPTRGWMVLVPGHSPGCPDCRGAALWQTLDGLRWLRLVSPTTGQGGDRE